MKITNSFSDEDDYYVKFKGNQKTDGEGVWEETVRPGLYNEFEETVMPHRIVRTLSTTDGDGDNIFTFYVGPIFWDNREVGDNLTNPTPALSIGKDPDQTNNSKPIERVVFYRNRLASWLVRTSLCLALVITKISSLYLL